MKFPKYLPSGVDTKIAILPADHETRELPPLTAEHFFAVCRPGHAPVTCRYLVMGPEGIGCCKATALGAAIDGYVRRGEMRARGDNCEGRIGTIPPEVWVERERGA